jgi:hypothetical protein
MYIYRWREQPKTSDAAKKKYKNFDLGEVTEGHGGEVAVVRAEDVGIGEAVGGGGGKGSGEKVVGKRQCLRCGKCCGCGTDLE